MPVLCLKKQAEQESPRLCETQSLSRPAIGMVRHDLQRAMLSPVFG